MLVKHKHSLLMLVLFLSPYSHSVAEKNPSANALFFAATSAAYQEIISDKTVAEKSTDLNQIIKLSEIAIDANNYAKAMATIVLNMPAITQQIGSSQIQKIAALALSIHGMEVAQSLLSQTTEQGDNFTEARITFEIAKYHADEARWPEVIRLLKNATIIESLAKEDADEANLLIGAALQQQKKHREAMLYYEKVKSDSTRYRLAQLNLATANLRQDWWTDAHLAVKNALKTSGVKKDELDYRLYTLLGYSQIQFGFYRDARESFRNVSVNSRYTNRALLGLGMAALHQEDFIGALSAFNHLLEKQTHDISVAESYLLNAFTLRQLGQHDDAIMGYQEAISHYIDIDKNYTVALSKLSSQSVIGSIEEVFLRPENRNNKKLHQLTKKILILTDLLNQSLSDSRIKALSSIKILLENEYLSTVRELLIEEQKMINSYLSQSKFGLATLYDGK